VTHKEFRKVRVEAEIPQFDVSIRSNIDRSRISLYECGHVSLRNEEVTALEHALRELIGERANRLVAALSTFGEQSLLAMSAT
jgi:hypothetical protein